MKKSYRTIIMTGFIAAMVALIPHGVQADPLSKQELNERLQKEQDFLWELLYWVDEQLNDFFDTGETNFAKYIKWRQTFEKNTEEFIINKLGSKTDRVFGKAYYEAIHRVRGDARVLHLTNKDTQEDVDIDWANSLYR